MKNGFTKIPNSILELPWANNPTVVYLYTWLSLHADKKGMVRMSLNEISAKTHLNKMQVRRALEKLRVTQVVTQLATQPATQLPNVITICYLTGCKVSENKSDIASDIACDTGSDTPRAYKNDNINIMSIQDVNKTDSSLRSESHTHNSALAGFEAWLREKCPFIYANLTPLKESELIKLKTNYTSEQIADTCENIENRKDLRKNYSNLYRTLLNWLKRDYGTAQTTQRAYQGSEHPTNAELRSNTIEMLGHLKAERHARNSEVRK